MAVTSRGVSVGSTPGLVPGHWTSMGAAKALGVQAKADNWHALVLAADESCRVNAGLTADCRNGFDEALAWSPFERLLVARECVAVELADEGLDVVALERDALPVVREHVPDLARDVQVVVLVSQE